MILDDNQCIDVPSFLKEFHFSDCDDKRLCSVLVIFMVTLNNHHAFFFVQTCIEQCMITE